MRFRSEKAQCHLTKVVGVPQAAGCISSAMPPQQHESQKILLLRNGSHSSILGVIVSQHFLINISHSFWGIEVPRHNKVVFSVPMHTKIQCFAPQGTKSPLGLSWPFSFAPFGEQDVAQSLL